MINLLIRIIISNLFLQIHRQFHDKIKNVFKNPIEKKTSLPLPPLSQFFALIPPPKIKQNKEVF